MLVVMKFGGTSVGSVAALQQVISIVKKARGKGEEVVVVVSAMNRITDLLLSSARRAETGDVETCRRAHQDMLARHSEVVGTIRCWPKSMSCSTNLMPCATASACWAN
jgi:aspartokinase/homoserine dehydrogenase 1